MARWMNQALFSLLAGGLVLSACGGSSDTNGMQGSGDGDSGGDGDKSGQNGTKEIIRVTEIPGGGENSGPLKAGCPPETANDCTAPGGGCDNSEFLSSGEVEVKKAGAVCFYGEGIDEPSATVEHITEVVKGEEYVHLRVIFDPNFVDTTFGQCSLETGWGPDEVTEEPIESNPDDKPKGMPKPKKSGHTFEDLRGSDHVQMILKNCDDEISMDLKVDFLDDNAEAECGYATAGVTGGDGKVNVGNAEDVLAVGTSLTRNMNGCGYCDLEESPCPSGDGYAPSEEAPEWDFRMVYELWIKTSAFGDSGFCTPVIEYVHASPSKESSNTILVEPDDCPPPPGGCPPNYELFLTSEGEFLCAGPPGDGGCEIGFEIDITSEGELCIPEGQQ